MNSTKVVTIIVTAWNEEEYIGRCIRSLISQEFPREKFKIIVVNDASTDRTPYAMELFKEDIIIINNDNNVGLPASLNIAISRVKTPYFVRVDADDYVSKNFIFFLYNYISQNNYMDAVACDYNIIDNNENIISRENCMENPIACGIIFRTDQIIQIGLYDENFLMHEERDLRIRFLKKYKIHRLELPLYRYRKHDRNMTNNAELKNLHLQNLIKKHKSE
tara:strand:+ start:680 stop:1339 length:660 start_codon:yes stop_codon:yes gene_type:complete